jgi:two-component system chemotaxis sensor kinase CheA
MLCADLLTLEQTPPAEVPSRIHRLFRAMHSIKGGAGYLGRRTIEQLAHRLETILGRLQKGSLPVSPALIDVLLAGVDRIQALTDDLDNSDHADLGDLLDRLAPYLDEKSGVSAETRLERLPSAPSAGALVLTEDTRRLRPAGHRFIYAVQVDLSFCQRERGIEPIEVIQRLQAAGALLDARLEVPDFDLETGLPSAGICYQALLSSVRTLEELQRTLDLPGLRILLLEPAPEDIRSRESGVRSQEADTRHPTPDSRHPTPQTTPVPATIRLPVQLVDRLMTLAGELVLVRNQAMRLMDSSDPVISGLTRRLDAVTGEIQDAVMRARMQAVGSVFNRFPRLVRDVARQLGKQINLIIEGNEVELDKTILEALSDPLTHLVRNSCDHGIERPEVRRAAGKPAEGTIWLTARPAGGQIVIEIRDDGKGIDPNAIRRKATEKGLFSASELARMGDAELFRLILLAGFSTASKVTDLSGRGVGMDVVKNNLDRLGGTLEIHSQIGRGSTFSLQLPLTLAIIPCLLVEGGDQRYAIPQKDIQELLCLQPGLNKARIEYAFDQEVVRLRDKLLPLVRFDEVLRRHRPFTATTRAAILRERQKSARPSPATRSNIDAMTSTSIAVVKVGSQRYGLVVDRILGSEEIVVKSLHAALGGVAIFAGATILGDGQIALILSTEGIARHAGVRYEVAPAAGVRSPESGVGLPTPESRPATQGRVADSQVMMLFRHGPAEQFAVPLAMVKRVERIRREQIDRVGGREFVTLESGPARVVRLDSCLSVSKGVDSDEMFLLVPRTETLSIGVLMTEIVDTIALDVELAREAFRADAIVGSTVLRGKMTLLLDLYRLMDLLVQAEQQSLKAVVPTRKARVLLVEDTAFFQQLVRGYLEAAGFDVVVAGNGREGLTCLRAASQNNLSFDLIVSDIEMPVMNGWEFARTLRELPETEVPGARQLPLLALTTLNSERDRARARVCGFNAYEVKVDRDRFLKAVSDVLRSARSDKVQQR